MHVCIYIYIYTHYTYIICISLLFLVDRAGDGGGDVGEGVAAGRRGPGGAWLLICIICEY